MKARIALTGVVAILLAGCTQPAPTATSTARPTPSTSPSAEAIDQPPLRPVGEPVTIVSGLNAPWSMVRLDGGSTLISERDTALVRELQADGGLRDVGQIPDVGPDGEGGLLGLAVTEIDGTTWLYTYFTSLTDNRIVRFELTGDAGNYGLGNGDPVFGGITRSGNHNGGRIAFGPDGMLYATVGDASNSAFSQDPTSLNGKILRMEPDGSLPGDNPIAGSFTWSYGHRNPQGIAWDERGQLWAAEFGQNTWDEFNEIEAGANYGWPFVEGTGDDPAYVNPIHIWSTDAASPSGLTYINGTFFMAALGGERLWVLNPGAADPIEFYSGQFGRIRDVIPGPDDTLWMLTNNTDGRGDPRDGDDRILQVTLG